MGGAPRDGAAPPPGCRGWGLGEQAAATPRPGSLAGQRQGDRDTPRREGARERPREEARTGGKRWKEEQAGPPCGVGTRERCSSSAWEPWAGRWMDDSRPWLPSEPLSWAHRGPGWPDCSQAPSHCPIVQRPSEEKGLAVGQDGGKGAQPQLSCPSWAALTDRTGDRRGWGRAVSIQPCCHPPKAGGPAGCCAPAPLSEPLSQPQLGGNSQRQLGSVSGSRPLPRWCSATTTDGSHAFPDRLVLSPPCKLRSPRDTLMPHSQAGEWCPQGTSEPSAGLEGRASAEAHPPAPFLQAHPLPLVQQP